MKREWKREDMGGLCVCEREREKVCVCVCGVAVLYDQQLSTHELDSHKFAGIYIYISILVYINIHTYARVVKG